MPSIVNSLNDHLRRLSRREINRETRSIRKLTAQHRRDLAALKRQIAAMQKAIASLERQEKKQSPQPAPADASDGLRFRADGLRSHRNRLGLSAEEYGKLVGVSGQSVYNWETGKSRPRRGQLPKLAAVRGLGKREAARRLDDAA